MQDLTVSSRRGSQKKKERGFSDVWFNDYTLCGRCHELREKGNFCTVCGRAYEDDDMVSDLLIPLRLTIAVADD